MLVLVVNVYFGLDYTRRVADFKNFSQGVSAHELKDLKFTYSSLSIINSGMKFYKLNSFIPNHYNVFKKIYTPARNQFRNL
eukprot:snap_masked-scaffold_8-processed-gene-3.33-mRNA-1 protein AED:0.99 eAED:1.00 QI:0/0/0/0.5/1/1/2/0/80